VVSNGSAICYISPICPEAPIDGFAPNWRSRRGRRRNHLYQIFWCSVKGCLFCGGSKIAISHWQSQSPLTQGWRYRAARDIQNAYKRWSRSWCRGITINRYMTSCAIFVGTVCIVCGVGSMKRYSVLPYVCLSVCLSVCQSHSPAVAACGGYGLCPVGRRFRSVSVTGSATLLAYVFSWTQTWFLYFYVFSVYACSVFLGPSWITCCVNAVVSFVGFWLSWQPALCL